MINSPLKKAKRIVLKIGSSLLVNESTAANHEIEIKMAEGEEADMTKAELKAELEEEGYKVK